MAYLTPFDTQQVLGDPRIQTTADAVPFSHCKAFPRDSEWPSSELWGKLNTDTGGRLLRAVPPGAACHPERDEFNITVCLQVAEKWETYEFHLEDPVSVMWDNGNNASCLPDLDRRCDEGGYPAYIVNASQPEHVKLAVDFGTRKNIFHLVICFL